MAAFEDYAINGSLLFGDMGTALLAMRLAPSSTIAELVYTRADAEPRICPFERLMWGMPGSMLACLFMNQMTNEGRWRPLFDVQAARLLADLRESAGWPDLGTGSLSPTYEFLGPVHGYAGNMLPLLQGWDWLTEEQRSRMMDVIPRTLSRNAWRTEIGTSWRARVGHDKPPSLCQYCHGARAWWRHLPARHSNSRSWRRLLEQGGQFAWVAGPLAKAQSRHGTSGNGYAFLKLYQRTQHSIWLERARAFAMTGDCAVPRGTPRIRTRPILALDW